MNESAAANTGAEDWSDAQHLRVFLARRDVPCPACDYNLRGVTVTCCPECGRELALLLAPRDRAPWPWLLAMLGCWSTVFFSLLLLALFWTAGGSGYARAIEWMIFLMCITLSVAGVPLCFLCRQIRRWKIFSQWLLVSVIWGGWSVAFAGLLWSFMGWV